MESLLILGKRGGILNWYEDVTASAGSKAFGLAMNHATWQLRLVKNAFGDESLTYRRMVAKHLEHVIQQIKPTHILVIDLFYFEQRPELNEILIASGAKTAQWIGDKFDSKLVANRGISDFFFTDTALAKQGHRLGLNSYYLPLATAPSRILPPWSSRSDELLFIAAPSENRIKLLEKINYPTRVIGPNWPRLRNTAISVNNKRLALADVRKLYTKHKYVLNTINSNNIISGLPSRCFDVAGQGACLVTDDVADLSLNLVPGKECLVIPYNSSGNAVADILSNATNVAQSIAQAGHTRTLKEHTWSNRWGSIRCLMNG
ncbi:glycosyltransferase [Paraperlucidibaca sp.]|jgi:spore maturation protein CgeB|uniref:glycosyltransferase family protein n=1 Tax=Paraperlucidibaca sp. TaxID=2708021 RepID=UPI00398A162D|tara:strand:+ start:583 stop:1536 length:954 start_codon:yes stop_codon:yes gene_type:complete